MWQTVLPLNMQRRLLLRQAEGPLQAYLQSPLPKPGTPCPQLRLLAVDLETTGLNPKQDQILSLGMVELGKGSIKLGTAVHRVARIEGEIPAESAVVHGITDDRAAQGESLKEILSDFLTTLKGAVLLAHHARIERGFLDAACRRLFGAGLVMPIVDTQHLASRMLQRQQVSLKPGDLRLFNLRDRYGLPRYGAHNALSDALGCAELYLALRATAGERGCKLRDITGLA